MTAPSDRQIERIGLTVGLVIVAITAITRIDDTGLWLDEAYSLGAANRLAESLRGTSGTMGLYYVILSGWASVSTATWWLRLPSVAFAMATLFVVRAIARRIGGARLAAVAVVFTALGPLFAWKAIEARAYALEVLLAAGCWYAVLQLLDLDDPIRLRRWYRLAGLLGAAGVFSHGLFVVQFVPMVAVLLLGAAAWTRALSLTVAFAPAVIVVLVLRANGADAIGTNVGGGIDSLIASTFDSFLATSVVAKLVLAQLLVVAMALAVRRAVRQAPSAQRAVGMIPTAWALLPCIALALVSLYDPVYNPRYLVPAMPGVALLLAGITLRIDGALRKPRVATAFGPAVAVTAGLMAWVLIMTPPPFPDDWRGAARLVADGARAGDGIVFANRSTTEAVQQRPPFEAAWREVDHDHDLIAISPTRPLAEVRRFDDPLPSDELVSATADLERLWVVENQAGGIQVADALLAESGLETAFEEVDRWVLAPEIVVVLLERAP